MLDPVLWVRLLDGVAGLFMWLFLLQALLTLVLPDNSHFSIFVGIKRITGPLLRLSLYITPAFIVSRLHPLIACFWLLVIRFYMFPTALGYELKAFSNMPLEQLVLQLIQAVIG